MVHAGEAIHGVTCGHQDTSRHSDTPAAESKARESGMSVTHGNLLRLGEGIGDMKTTKNSLSKIINQETDLENGRVGTDQTGAGKIRSCA